MISAVTAALAFLVVAASAGPAEKPLILLDLAPEEAQKYLRSPPFQQPQLSAKGASLPLVKYSDANFRAADSGPLNGHYLRNGLEIENTGDYLEDVYEAQQFHGQDGLGAAAFGYAAPESSRLENIESDGNVKGSYTYRDPLNRLIQVQYYADQEGFHQEDNIPHVELQQVQETEDVREARLAHEKAWQEAADLAKANPDPSGEYDGRYEVVDPNENAQYVEKSQKIQEQPKPKQYKGDNDENAGPPRGFFYSFKYPVSILTQKSQSGQGVGQGQIVDADTIAINAQATNARYQIAERPIEVHDAQVPQYSNGA